LRNKTVILIGAGLPRTNRRAPNAGAA